MAYLETGDASTRVLSIAPGEGKTPFNILSDEKFEEMAILSRNENFSDEKSSNKNFSDEKSRNEYFSDDKTNSEGSNID